MPLTPTENTSAYIQGDIIQADIQVKKDDFLLDVSIGFPLNGVTGIYGHSGAGKTTLLRCIAGLEAFQGQLLFGERCWHCSVQSHIASNAERKPKTLPAYQRSVGYVFQDAGLFPHLSVAGNLRFAEKRATDKAIISFEQAVELLSLGKLLSRKPEQLSGGEKQRVAIARALLVAPTILLLDEPLASLGRDHKEDILPYLETLKAALKIPMLYVSHNMDEIARLSDHLLLLKNGRKLAEGPIQQVSHQLTVAEQLMDDAGVVLEGKIKTVHPNWHLAEAVIINSSISSMNCNDTNTSTWVTNSSDSNNSLWLKNHNFAIDETVRIRILAKDVSLSINKPELSSILNQLQGKVVEVLNDQYDPAIMHLKVRCCHSPEMYVIAAITKKSLEELDLMIGSNVWLQIKSVAVIV